MTTDQRIENLEKGLASARRLNRWLLAAVGLALGDSALYKGRIKHAPRCELAALLELTKGT